MKSSKYLISAVMATATMASCACGNKAANNERGTIQLSAEEARLAEQSNTFAWNMLAEVENNADTENTVVSPLSMTYALGMACNGANGNTRKEITTTLGFDGNTENLNNYCRKMTDRLPALDKNTRVDIANSVMVNKQYTLKSDFTKTAEKMYGALAESKDFADNGFKDYINGWCSKHTNGMIPTIIDNPDPSAVAYLLNALYFKGQWTSPFEKHNTNKGIFTKADGKKTPMDMMWQKDEFAYKNANTFDALSMDYGNGAYSMQILLPHKGMKTSDVVNEMKQTSWKDFVAQMTKQEVEVTIPKFTIEYGDVMNNVLKRLGINDAFDSNKADFSLLCDASTYISRVIQKAKIEVDEEGTKAAAVTAVEIMLTSAGPDNSLTFIADHPFVFAITEHSTGTICFIGTYKGF